MAFSAEYVYRILDQYSGPLARITRATAKFQDMSLKASGSMRRMGGKLKAAGDSMTGLSTVIGGAAITAGLFKFTKSASDMKDAMADVSRVTGLTGMGLDKMQAQLQLMGRQTGRNAEGLAAMAYEGGKLGIANQDMIGFVGTVLKTASAFDMADQEAGRSIGSIKAKLGLTVPAVDELMQRVNYLADTTSASGNQMINIIERTSGTFKVLKIPPEITAGWAAFADQIEVSPEKAATGLNMMMARLMKMPGMLNKMLKDPQNTVINFLQKFGSMPEATRGTAVLKMFGEEAGRFVLKTITNMDLLDTSMKKAASAKALGSMDREFANILARSSTMAKRLKQTFLDISRAIGKVFLKVFDKYSKRLFEASQWILSFIKNHPGLVRIAGAMGLIAVAVAALIFPFGLLMSMIGTALPVLSALAAAIGAISWPVVLVVASIAILSIAFIAMYKKSAMLRQSVANLSDAFKPLWTAIKETAIIIAKTLVKALGGSGADVKSFGDALSVVIDLFAAIVSSVIQATESFGEFMGAISLGNWEDAFGPTLEWLDSIISKFEILRDAKEFWGNFFGSPDNDRAEAVQRKKMPAKKSAEAMKRKKMPAKKSAEALRNKVAKTPIVVPKFDLSKYYNIPIMQSNSNFEKLNKNMAQAPTPQANYWPTVKNQIGQGAAANKAGARQDNKMEVSGQIGVTATGNAKVERADINLNQGYNLAVAQ